MHPVTERDIRGSFVNCSRGEAQRANLPEGLDELPWTDLDFLGWVVPKAAQLAYVVVPGDRLLGIKLRRRCSGYVRGWVPAPVVCLLEET